MLSKTLFSVVCTMYKAWLKTQKKVMFLHLQIEYNILIDLGHCSINSRE